MNLEHFSTVYTQVDESERKTPQFGHVSGDFESGILSGKFESISF